MRFLTTTIIAVATTTMLSLTKAQDDDCLSIAEIACTTDGFDTLCELLELSGLDEALNGNATFTVFAPLNAAFEELPDQLVTSLVNDTDLLTDVLLYHAVAGQSILQSDLNCEAGENLVEMANGKNSRTICETTENTIIYYQKGSDNDRSDMPRIVETDIEACNESVIHIVDGVLLPPGILEGLEDSRAPTEVPVMIDESPISSPVDDEGIIMEDEPVVAPLVPSAAPVDVAMTDVPVTRAPVAEGGVETPDGCMSIAALACSLDDFSTLCTLLNDFGLYELLDTAEWTAFAPTNAAFERIEATLGLLDSDTIRDVLVFHVVPDDVIFSDQLACGELLEMGNGKNSRTKCSDDVVYQAGADNIDAMLPEIVDTDLLACNGIVHVVSEVMLPAGTLP